jgi:hypothetical protein
VGQKMRTIQYTEVSNKLKALKKQYLEAQFLALFILHFSLQYFTSSQTFSHFLRHVNGLLQTRQTFCGKNAFLVFLILLFV